MATTFEKHPAPKGTCPKCGHKKVFRYYQNLQREYGRCERVNSCGYHLKPNGQMVETDKLPIPAPTVKTKIIFPDEAMCRRFIEKDHISPFHKICMEKLNIPIEHFRNWNIGSRGDETAFVFQDKNKKFVNIKFVEYDENCNRKKKIQPYSLPPGRADEKYSLCLFGEHLLSDKIVCLVESEKTAFIASNKYPQFDWLATGSSNGLTDEKIFVLHNRQVYYLPDADKAGRENSSINALHRHKINFTLIDLFPDRNDGYDLADAIFDGLCPEIKPSGKAPEQINDAKTSSSLPPSSCFNKDNCYFVKERTQHGLKNVRVSNFVMKVLYLLQSKNNPKYIIEILNKDNDKKVIDIPVRSFVSIAEFRSVIEAKGNFLFNGNLNQLYKIKEELFRDLKPAIELSTLGWQPDYNIYAFANGILTATNEFKQIDYYGIVDDSGQSFYLPAFSKINSDSADYINEKKFIYKKGEIDFQQWCKLITAVFGLNGNISVCFVIASLFRDIIFVHLNFFPILFLFGERQKGKSTLLDATLSIFGDLQSKISLGSASSPKGFNRKLSQIRNGVIAFEEYKNNIDFKLIEMLKSLYDGIGYERAIMSNDNRTQSTPVNSTCIITGQELPTKEAALFSRTIMLEFTTDKFENIQEYNELKKHGEEKGLGQVVKEILQHRKYFQENFKNEFENTYQELKLQTLKGKNIPERTIKNLITILVPIKLLSSHLKFSFEYDEMFKACVAYLLEQHEIMTRTSDVMTFWKVVEQLKENLAIMEGKQYSIKQIEGIEIIYIRFSAIYPKYNEFCLKQRTNSIDKESLLRYLKAHGSFVRDKQNDFHKIKMDGQSKSAFAFKYQELGINLVDPASELKVV